VNDHTKHNAATTPDPHLPPTARSSPGRSSRGADAMAFLRAFITKPLEVASVAPSSVYLEARIVRAAQLAKARCVVELGPGTGGTTRALLQAMSPQARLLAIEVNEGFCDRLRRLIDDPRLAVQAGSAESLADMLQRRRLPAPDVIISGIPFSTLPREVAQRIAAAIHANLAPGGRFVAYQLRAHVADYLEPHLGPTRSEWEWRGVTPMRVYAWVKPEDAAAATPAAGGSQEAPGDASGIPGSRIPHP
jgi:phosphatidylethanolamine/phosphatidyl-N-methylethanolamine N-methyltransferase